MAAKSYIEWTDSTWNPIVGCSIVSPGCTNCYAMRTAARMASNPQTPHYHGTVQSSKAGPVWTGKVAMASDATLLAPLRWKYPRRVFVNSMGDLFHEDIPDAWIDKVFAVMALCPQHTFQVLTKRAERMWDYMLTENRCHIIGDQMLRLATIRTGFRCVEWPFKNCWLGVSCERQPEADERIPHLLQTPAAVRFISAEPLLGPIEIWAYMGNGGGWQTAPGDVCKLDWIIVGGESGPNARPMHPQWARDIRDQCQASGVAFFFKQWGAHVHATQCNLTSPDPFTEVWIDENTVVGRVGKKRAGRLLDGREHNAFPVIEGREFQPGLSSPDKKQTEDASA